MDENTYTLTEHLTELRERLLKSIAGVLVTTFGALAFAPTLLDYSVEPLTKVLSEKNRLDTLLVHEDPLLGSNLEKRLEERDNIRLVGLETDLDGLRDLARERILNKHPLDLVIVSSGVIHDETALVSDLLEHAEPQPYVVYLVRTSTSPIVTELMLEGANVVIDPPRGAVLGRIIRRAAGAAGKTASKDKLVVLSPLEPFFAWIKIALVCGLFLACPIWIYQAWQFIAPGLYDHEKSFVLPSVVSASLLFVSGGAFAYFVMFPMMFDVLVNQMMPSTLVGTFTVDNYLGLLLRVTVAFGVVFETPLVLALLAAVGIVTAEKLRSWRKYAVVVSFILGAVLTPADPLSQVAMAIPLVVFYELGIIAASIVQRRRKEAGDHSALEGPSS